MYDAFQDAIWGYGGVGIVPPSYTIFFSAVGNSGSGPAVKAQGVSQFNYAT